MLTLLASTAACLAPATAGAATLFDHVDPTPPAAIVSQFPADASAQGAIAYDDFTIPPGQVWQLQRLFVDGSASGTATSTQVYLQLDRNQGTPPNSATPLYAELLTPGPGAAYPDLDLDLGHAGTYPPGSYWISARAQLPLGPSSNRWFWQANSDQFGDLALWQENSAYGTGCVPALKPRNTDCLPGTGPDQSFRLEGESLPARIQVLKAKAGHNGSLKLAMSLPSCCALGVRSKQMGRRFNQGPRDVGRFAVKLKPNAKTRRRLERGDAVTARVTLSINPLQPGSPDELDFPPVEVVRKLKP